MIGTHQHGVDEDAEHAEFRDLVRGFLTEHVIGHLEAWDRDGRIDKALFTAAGDLGLLGFSVDPQFGGLGVKDYSYNAILLEETSRIGAAAVAVAFALQNDIVLPYLDSLGTATQKSRWLPGVVSGRTILAIAMTEPGTGSDLAGIGTRAVRDGDDYALNGAKTFISNGQNADLFVVAARTGEDRHHGLSLIVVEAGTAGFTRGRNLDKIGLHAQDTSELSFADARVPSGNLLGEEGRGMEYLRRNLAQERLALALGAVAAGEGILMQTLDYVRQRTAFGQPISEFQNTQFVLAELATELDAARTFVDDCVREHNAGGLTVARAAAVKWWTTELQVRVADRCLQLHGGYGYMSEYAVARAFIDARIQTIYGGTTEVLKELVGRELVR